MQAPTSAVPSLVDHLLKSLSSRKQKREFGACLHASAITSEDFCPREVALLEATNVTRGDERIQAALQATFDVGEAVAELHRMVWLRDLAVGDWECRVCGQLLRFTGHPGTCAMCGSEFWKYRELVSVDSSIATQGSVDLLVNFNLPGSPWTGKLHVVELKIISPDDFKKLKAPDSEHRIRTVLYLDLLRKGNHPFRNAINLDTAKVLYTARNWGAMDSTRGIVHPFKEFDVPYDASSIALPRHMASLVKRWREQKIMPLGICTSPAVKRAQACKVCHACFSGKYPGSQ